MLVLFRDFCFRQGFVGQVFLLTLFHGLFPDLVEFLIGKAGPGLIRGVRQQVFEEAVQIGVGRGHVRKLCCGGRPLQFFLLDQFIQKGVQVFFRSGGGVKDIRFRVHQGVGSSGFRGAG